MADLTAMKRKAKAVRHLPTPAMRRAIRVEAGLTQEDVAEPLEVQRETVSRWEAGKRTPRGRLLIQYAELLAEIQRNA